MNMLINRYQYDFLVEFISNSKEIESNSKLAKSIKFIKLMNLEDFERLLEKHDKLSPSICYKIDESLSFTNRLEEVIDFLKIVDLYKYVVYDSQGHFALESSAYNLIQEYENTQEELKNAHEANALAKKANDIAEKALKKSHTSNVIAIVSGIIAVLSLAAAIVAIILKV